MHFSSLASFSDLNNFFCLSLRFRWTHMFDYVALTEQSMLRNERAKKKTRLNRCMRDLLQSSLDLGKFRNCWFPPKNPLFDVDELFPKQDQRLEGKMKPQLLFTTAT